MGVGQNEFTSALLDPREAAPRGLTAPDGQPAGKRFNVYRNNVAFSLTEALVTAFPAIHRLLGDEFFRAMAGIYLRRNPPSSALMMFYGEEMPGFLGQFEPVAHLEYLPDLARLELARRQSYHAADAAPIDPAALQALPPDELMQSRLRLAPATRLLRSPWPVLSLWRHAMEEGEPIDRPRAEEILVSRAEFDPVMAPLPAGGVAFISALGEGRTFADAAGEAGEEHDLTTTLGAMLAGGTITEISRDKTE